MNSEPMTACDFIDPGHHLDHGQRRAAMFAMFVPWLGTGWLLWRAMRGNDKARQRVYMGFASLSMAISLTAVFLLN